MSRAVKNSSPADDAGVVAAPATHEQALAAMAAARRIGYALILWGDVGIGKSQLVGEFARREDLPLHTVIASQSDPTDFGGMPVLDPDAKLTTPTGEIDAALVDYAPPRWAVDALHTGKAVIFLDEFSNASPAVQSAALEVVLNRRIGSIQLPDGVQFIAAANPPEIASSGFDLAAPTANRFMHLDLSVPTITAWSEGLMTGWGTNQRTPLERRVALRVSGFLATRPELLHARPDNDTDAGRAWPSPRTWEQVFKALVLNASDNDGQLNRLGDTERLIVQGLVGPYPAREFLHWMRHLDLPDPEALLADPSLAELSTSRPDRTWAILVSITDLVASRIDDEPGLWTQGLAFLAEAAASAPDAAAFAARALPPRPAGAEIPPNVTSFLGVLGEAGLLAG